MKCQVQRIRRTAVNGEHALLGLTLMRGLGSEKGKGSSAACRARARSSFFHHQFLLGRTLHTQQQHG